MKKPILLIMLILFISVIIFSPVLYSLTPTVTVELTMYLSDNSTVLISELLAGMLGGDAASVPLFFQLTITNSNLAQELVLKFGLNRGSEPVVEGTSDPFTLDINPKTITSQGLLSESFDYSLKSINITDEADDIMSQIMRTGQLPPGNYNFWVKIVNPDNENEVWAQHSQDVYLGSLDANLVLISPGQRADYPEIIDVYNNQPIFQWQSSSRFFNFKLYEEQPHNNGNPQSVINNEVHFELNGSDESFSSFINVVELGTAPALFLFQMTYSSSAMELKPNFNYYWKVEALDGSGAISTESEIWRFKYADPAGGVSNVDHQQIVTILQTLLGDTKYEELFVNEGGAFKGFTYGGEMYLNGNVIEFNKLHEIFVNFLAGKIEIGTISY